ncbi:NADH:ubiquinone reductase (Na(+)-transporting) subunit D [Ponticoccus sp. SC2-23]|uniref:NADH:ubiquinone reductase (Na(+)-transporting) subunit D n=1 Tax=Alexandriicola marinus TaxID=2081710 RepID=UPI000FD6ED74|nr:NADH:ubiquinone reductase (Na(+)-transporting) subunit D [Alexandriicola marinus]MBM1218984.1 NADH:ubiquinone reductase (Na(+)-transporting) subunit D [Ponticoccus sp. SC6-9]MBM1223944.1 NADH:ubiquinone reductase (Na(+)-transporting) subunit D [Ponticoccus sp. SC6-15]MBM1230277.1 NADH:ubiquinone reductase (Na(+)-transporting) subunit D [Ponticoccus sp. SC6-38]MBM1232910.1 NADH:ubiquinone reductase (Na(+)-transporting) subunit D [Ponticoccus sp. SC6-45]MBM1237140.1 NADH:ubiquinone reductase 
MARTIDYRKILTEPLIRQNPVTLQILGICSALAVTTTLATAVTMSVSLTVVLTLSAGVISMIRRHIPDTIRLIVQIVIVASLVIVIDQLLQAYFAEISRALSVYVGLITTNCLVLGRTEAFARHNAPGPAMVDAFGNGLGYSLILIIIGGLRELFGKGELFGVQVLPLADAGGWFTPLSLMLLAPSAFFLLGLLVWAIRSLLPEQAEAPEHVPPLRAEPAE